MLWLCLNFCAWCGPQGHSRRGSLDLGYLRPPCLVARRIVPLEQLGETQQYGKLPIKLLLGMYIFSLKLVLLHPDRVGSYMEWVSPQTIVLRSERSSRTHYKTLVYVVLATEVLRITIIVPLNCRYNLQAVSEIYRSDMKYVVCAPSELTSANTPSRVLSHICVL